MTRFLTISIVGIIIGAAPYGSYGQSENALTFPQVDSLQQIERKPMLVFIHTDWCRYCRAMENATFQDEAVVPWLDSAFYFVSLDAEARQEIRVQGQTFGYQPTGQGTGQHELAQVLASVDGTVTFPTLCFLNEDYEIVYQQVGFVDAARLAAMLQAIHGSI